MKERILVLIFLSFLLGPTVHGQETVFGLLKREEALADQFYEKGRYAQALDLLNQAIDKTHDPKQLALKLARCYFALKEYKQAAMSFEKYSNDLGEYEFNDLYTFAESLASIQNYSKAIACYRECLDRQKGDNLLIRKIWQLTHKESLFEDTTHFAVRPLSINSGLGEFGAVYYQDGIAFVSNRPARSVVEKVNATTGSSFYRIYTSAINKDTIAGEVYNNYQQPGLLDATFNKNLHVGPISFYSNGTKCVFASNASKTSAGGMKTLQLFFAELRHKQWKIIAAYPFNNYEFSLTHPSINEEGTLLLFSSDMPGGKGMRDLYKSEYIDGRWTPPANLGDEINTSRDEVFPYIYQHDMLYFSSNGLPGMGGLDIFKSIIIPTGFETPQNVGAPVNSSYDDFGIVLDVENANGYFSSNRKSGGYDDDIYELAMDLQPYPVTVAGVVKYKEHTWSDASQLTVMPHARINLIDRLRNITVYESTTDNEGNFSIVVPYFSKYIVQIVSIDNDENLAILEIPKQKTESSAFEIVVVKDLFKEASRQGPK